MAATATTVIAYGLAWAGRRSRAWRSVMLGTMIVALATPGPVAGRALVLAYRDWPELYDSSAIVVMAQALRALPLCFARPLAVPPLLPAGLSRCRRTRWKWPLGPNVPRRLPVIIRAVLASWMVALALGLGELPATNQVYPPGIEPMSVFLWGLLHTGVESHLSGVALVMLAVIALAGLAAAATLSWLRGFE